MRKKIHQIKNKTVVSRCAHARVPCYLRFSFSELSLEDTAATAADKVTTYLYMFADCTWLLGLSFSRRDSEEKPHVRARLNHMTHETRELDSTRRHRRRRQQLQCAREEAVKVFDYQSRRKRAIFVACSSLVSVRDKNLPTPPPPPRVSCRVGAAWGSELWARSWVSKGAAEWRRRGPQVIEL